MATPQSRSLPDRDSILKLKTAHPSLPLPLLELAATPTFPDTPGQPSPFTRDESAWELAWKSEKAGLHQDVALDLMETLHSLMAQPARDEYPLELALEKVYRVYNAQGGKDRIPRTRLRVRGDRNGGAIPQAAPERPLTSLAAFTLPFSKWGDKDRIRRLWENKIAAIPVPLGEKGGSGNPKWKHLQGAPPTENDWRKWEYQKFRGGNTAMLFGYAGDEAMALYDIEIEYAGWFDKSPHRDYFMANTPVVASKKSIHIYVWCKEILASFKSKGANKGQFEFRGNGNYSLAPGSLHPDSAPDDPNPVVYQQLNDGIGRILLVHDMQAFLETYFPELVSGGGEVEETEGLTEAAAARRRRQARMEELYAMREHSRRQVVNHQIEIGSLYPLDQDIQGYKLPILPRCYIQDMLGTDGREYLTALMQMIEGKSDGEEPWRIKSVRQCGWTMTLECDDHGERFRTKRTCKTNFDPNCPTQVARKILGLPALPDREAPGQGYTELEIIWQFSPTMDMAGEKEVKRQIGAWNDQVRKLNERKAFKGIFLDRSIAFGLNKTRPSLAFGRVLIANEREGQWQEVLDALEKKFPYKIVQAIKFHFVRGETAILQMAEDAMAQLLWLEDMNDPQLFSLFYYPTRRAHLFALMGALYNQVQEVPVAEPAACDICGKRLTAHTHPPGWERKENEAEGWGRSEAEGGGPARGASRDLGP